MEIAEGEQRASRASRGRTGAPLGARAPLLEFLCCIRCFQQIQTKAGSILVEQFRVLAGSRAAVPGHFCAITSS